MSKDITVDDAVTILASAFAPLRCVAEHWDYGERVRFRVFDEAGEPVLKADELLRAQVTDSQRLEAIVSHARGNLAARSFTLDPWSFPHA